MAGYDTGYGSWGAAVIEKHFTLDKTMFGWDHKVSADPAELAVICRGRDRIHAALGIARRIVGPRELQRRFADVSPKMAQIAPNVKEAINMAGRAVTRDDLICVTGWFYLAGEAKKLLLAVKK